MTGLFPVLFLAILRTFLSAKWPGSMYKHFSLACLFFEAPHECEMQGTILWVVLLDGLEVQPVL